MTTHHSPLTTHQAGKCKFCHCTSERACMDGCSWVDREHTICSACLPRLSEEELAPLWLEELTPAASLPFPAVEIDLMHAFAILAVLQVGLKHPQVQVRTKNAAGFASDFALAVGETLSQLGPLTAEVVRRGFAGCYRPPVEPGELIDGAHAALGEDVSPGGIIIP